jgi:hypothetical protein
MGSLETEYPHIPPPLLAAPAPSVGCARRRQGHARADGQERVSHAGFLIATR